MTRRQFGVECGKGWASLYEPVIKLAQETGGEILQVKEKWGLLRIYARGPAALFDAIEAAEEESAKVCESCGSRENVQRWGHGWIKTLCRVCRGFTIEVVEGEGE